MQEKPQGPHEHWFVHCENFGGLLSPPETKDRIVILPVPYETSTTYQPGCRKGPAAIIEASTNMELYDEELPFEPSSLGITTSRPLEPLDDPKEMTERIEVAAGALLDQHKFIIALGGEHTVSVGMVRAMRRLYDDLSVLLLDAHADFRDSYHGNKLNHGCVARRVSEICSLRQAGIRSLSKEEAVFLKERNLNPHWASEFRSVRLQGERQPLIDRLVDGLSPNVYISIDADVFDPSIMPAVGTPEPGGLLWDEVLDILKTVCKERKVVGADFVELAPIPGLVHPEFLGARLIYKLLGYAFENQARHR